MLASCFFSGLNERQQLKGLEMINSKTKQAEMPKQRFKKSLLAVSIVALSAPVFAQTDNKSEETMEEVVVVGMRTSINSAQELKRNADTVKDVITSSDIGALPDKSVTEALQRVPGVTIERFASSEDPNHFADEGTNVLVRGLDRVRSEVNGRDAFSANPWGGLNYEDFSPELLQSVEVVKNQTADLIAGGVAGTVNLITRKPFDSDGLVTGFTLKGSYGDFRDEWSPTVSGLFSDRWETSAGEFGFLISASSQELKTRGDRIGVANFYSRGDGANGPVDGPALTNQTPGTVLWMPGQASIATADNNRERDGLSSSLQWQNADETVVTTLEYIRSKATLTWVERVIGQQAQGFSIPDMVAIDTDVNQSVFDSNGFFVSGDVVGGPLLLSTRWNENINDVEDASFHLTLRPSDKLTLDFDYQRVESTSETTNYGLNARSFATEQRLDLSSGVPTTTYESGLNNPDMGVYSNDYVLRSMMEQDTFNDAGSDSYQIDAKYEIDNNWLTSVSAGIYYSDKDLTVRDTEYSNWQAVTCGWWGCGDTSKQTADPLPDPLPDGAADGAAYRESIGNIYNASQHGFVEEVKFDNFFGGGKLGGGDTFYFPSLEATKNLPDAIRYMREEGLTCLVGCAVTQRDFDNRIAEGSPFAGHQISAVNEERTEAYVRTDFAFDDLAVPIKGNLGLRYVEFQLASSGYATFPTVPLDPNNPDLADWYEEADPGVLDFANGAAVGGDTVEGEKFSKVLPSLNLTFGFSEDLIGRMGISEGIYLPVLVDARNNKTIYLNKVDRYEDPDDTTSPVVGIEEVYFNGQSRNPNLQPEEALSLDLSLEWYFAEAGSLAAALFYKDIDNLFRERYFYDEVTNNGQSRVVSFAGPTNEGSGTLQGIELSYSQFFDMLPGAWSGLGIQTNFTYIDQNDLNDDMGLGVAQTEQGVPLTIRDANGNLINPGNRNTFRNFSGLDLPGFSDTAYNIVGMYEYDQYSVRLAYNWRSEYLITRRDSNEFAPIYSEDTGYLDATFGYTINDHFKVGLEISNLLDTITETRAQYNQAGDTTDSLNFETDRRYAVYVRASF
jgi:iron complex outermembrane receptor protein